MIGTKATFQFWILQSYMLKHLTIMFWLIREIYWHNWTTWKYRMCRWTKIFCQCSLLTVSVQCSMNSVLFSSSETALVCFCLIARVKSTWLICLKFSVKMHFHKMNTCVEYDCKRPSKLFYVMQHFTET